ncbi:signal recognition particle-docking protein FtsY [Desulfovibrio sulfodismutans]|uniref:Signal recognition particle receptor FtsY n=1 Tax=Desulfolutivibrio sulfodismutans TaxID=63561 RepID=A0A7K3NPE1_9BACT|nr:signal recognition particle-docking protein FtsY [Desulfolutivibrio sulfodismutans]NDY58031.1 signal recognition particle-docking protein FtsY [Desulfolutivibrio sulfodismutans]QLA11752.1 signal recognition particle-docking protein FtsY [Desulfolutivibrio sulfodismutans DSM 3696]
MGFFSKIKRLWKKPDQEAAPVAETREIEDDGIAAASDAADALQAAVVTKAASVTAPPEAPEALAAPLAQTPIPATAPPAATTPRAAQAAPDTDAPWRNQLVLALREAEPRLSVWLSLVLTDVDRAGPLLWERLAFLFSCLDAPAAEAQTFVDQFRKWLTDMEYDAVEEFRSELQYRLALALDLEDEEDERNRLFLKLSESLAKTKEQIARRIDGLLGSHKVMDAAFWEEFEEILIMADLGYEPTAKLLEILKDRVRKSGETDPARFREILREELSAIFTPQKTIRAVNPPEVVMIIGVNGVGKTTTIAKLAHRASLQGKKVLIAAGDTFRAAAIDQLKIWADRVGAIFYAKGENADPAAVAYEAMDRAIAEGCDIMFLDTAGRLHTKANLMEELKKIKRVLGKKHPGAPHRCVLVLDATTGQNALSQTKLFNEAVDLDEIILTKLDGTAKGGVIVGIALEYGLPITFIGLGEKMEDLRPFSGQDFALALLT